MFCYSLHICVVLGLVSCLHFVAAEKLIFQDDFTTFDVATWKHEITMGGGGNWEFEMYLNNRSISFVNNSILYIRPQLTADVIGEAGVANGVTYNVWGSQPANLCTGNAFYGCLRTSASSSGGNVLNPIQSARVRTAKSFTFSYGRVEVRAKLPKGDWLWPAIWMLPAHNAYGEWPASGEIDIVESRGNDASYADGGINTFASTLHYGPFAAPPGHQMVHQPYKLPSGDFSQDFHVFGLIWNESMIATYLDTPDNIVLHVPINESFWQRGGFEGSSFANPWTGRGPSAPFDQEFYLIFNVAVGGTGGYFPDGVGNKPWTDKSAHAMNEFYAAKNTWYPTWQGDTAALQIDWVKVYQS